MSYTQYGFLNDKSTIKNLLELSNNLTKERDNDNNIDIICIDFTKVFYIVPT